MAKSKYAPALFEVINRQKNTGKLGVPKWWKGGSGGPQPEGGEPSVGDSGAATEAPITGPEYEALTPASPNPPARTATDAGVRSTDPSGQRESAYAAVLVDEDRPRTAPSRLLDFRMESGRIYLSLSPVHAAAACGGLLIAMIAAFLVGKGFAAPVAEKNNGLTLLNEKPNSSVLEEPAGRTDAPPSRAGMKPPGAAVQPVADAPPAPLEQEVLKVGSHYVLFDTYPRDHLQSADFVQKWLASEHKIRTVLRERKGRYWLVGTDVSGEKAACDRYAERIKALGPDCSKALIKAGLPVYSLKAPMPFLIASEK